MSYHGDRQASARNYCSQLRIKEADQSWIEALKYVTWLEIVHLGDMVARNNRILQELEVETYN